MKHISFRKLYKCNKCKRKIVGYVNKCPICNSPVTKVGEERIVTFTKSKAGMGKR